MVLQVYIENSLISGIDNVCDVSSLKECYFQKSGVPASDVFVTINGRKIPDDYNLHGCNDVVRIHYKLIGGKGGFGSMLRAIGAQIEKTTNREACRDLSGRRLRDINEEKRLRKWLDNQGEREREAVERKQKKLERLIAEPKIEVKLDDPVYEKERQELPERVSAAVDFGWQASTSETHKRKMENSETGPTKGKKKAKLWIDADLSDLSTDDEEEEIELQQKLTVSTDSGNESDKASEVSSSIV